MQQGGTLYRCLAGLGPNNLPQRGLESVRQSSSKLQWGKILPECYLIPPPQMSSKLWALMPQGYILYLCVAGVDHNNLQEPESQSVKWWWRDLPSSKLLQGCYLRPPPEKRAKSWVLIGQGRTLDRFVAGFETKNLPQNRLDSVQQLWRNLPFSKVPPGLR